MLNHRPSGIWVIGKVRAHAERMHWNARSKFIQSKSTSEICMLICTACVFTWIRPIQYEWMCVASDYCCFFQRNHQDQIGPGSVWYTHIRHMRLRVLIFYYFAFLSISIHGRLDMNICKMFKIVQRFSWSVLYLRSLSYGYSYVLKNIRFNR